MYDIIIGNPPYQAHSNNKGSNNILWDKFLIKAHDMLTDDGFLCAIHPSDWRSPSVVRKRLNSVLSNMLILYLEIHDFQDGFKTFGANTRYDWYVAQICRNNNNDGEDVSTIMFDDDIIATVPNISALPFIPNSKYDFIMGLMAKDESQRLQIIKDCNYHTHNHNHKEVKISKEKSNTHQYPCVYSVNKANVPKLRWSSFKNGHFGIPKVIFGNGATGFVADKSGEFGLTNFASGIVCSAETQPLIIAALKSDRFEEVMRAIQTGSASINSNVLKLFRKDFWKEFEEEKCMT